MLYNSNWYGGQYQDIQMFRTTTQGSLSILILHSISVTIVSIALKSRIWHIQYKYKFININGIWPPTHGSVTTIHGILTPPPMVYRTHYPWYFDPPTHGILTPYAWYMDLLTHGISDPLPMVVWPLYTWYCNPYAWYFDPLPIVYRSPNHDILTLIYMVCWPLYPWYIEPVPMVFWPLYMVFWPLYPRYNEFPTHGISTPYQWYFDPPMHSIWPPYSWHIEPPIHGISTPHSWYFDPPYMVFWPPSHGISTSLPIIYRTPYPW